LLKVTWQGIEKELELGSRIHIDNDVTVTRKLDDLIVLNRQYICIKYKARNVWKDQSKPEVMFECEWSNQFKIHWGIIDFEIHGSHLIFEVVDG
jgi:hypothetical protein